MKVHLTDENFKGEIAGIYDSFIQKIWTAGLCVLHPEMDFKYTIREILFYSTCPVVHNQKFV
jgi:hypothetical protein